MTAPETDTDEILKALAHPTRLEILAWLKEPQAYFAGQEHPLDFGVCAGQIEKRCDLSQSTVSAHLATLQRAGLVTTRKVGQWVFFRRDEDKIAAFLHHINSTLEPASSQKKDTP
ncbi:helix-turn-helix domain-containing protein [Shinella sp. AETb1-6]|jgi:ArsR family transcriptional regulator|uniref:Metalloregulator ArsR/SmtB family transcription factor n=1 Tax=Shinella sumterensis TaxID=1967501 RepID=A0AA50H669_9HYPH|nr:MULTISPECIES: metalloregulator ArsR/SmtB family transcription factor [Shinella]MDP9590867.1 ArsR family transcriptional regulator [Shinella zoogloeoides]MCD1263383.1 helix-turn-helix domain-containing protein [Shinella sumterensis]MXN49914.1 helix-turn-helix domain-containing protein [Shinella sp. AETb1-6]TFE99766.1 transcriptional regulator [Shinella sumterensis]WLR98043.1 metalloregulator ArsR/SmtB family transcription factor [Shinella sumterensis]